ncbi:hypothetical protein [Mesorhizobium sp. AR02]|uniref:hypothetical protein n=1 Tax=Mesorhizobium sp. AR02 TaxID=2865837 RepID=UPI00215EA65D|nr:hypothetical protein [Mesorhizobium sp. AR02]
MRIGYEEKLEIFERYLRRRQQDGGITARLKKSGEKSQLKPGIDLLSVATSKMDRTHPISLKASTGSSTVTPNWQPASSTADSLRPLTDAVKREDIKSP